MAMGCVSQTLSGGEEGQLEASETANPPGAMGPVPTAMLRFLSPAVECLGEPGGDGGTRCQRIDAAPLTPLRC